MKALILTALLLTTAQAQAVDYYEVEGTSKSMQISVPVFDQNVIVFEWFIENKFAAVLETDCGAGGVANMFVTRKGNDKFFNIAKEGSNYAVVLKSACAVWMAANHAAKKTEVKF